MHCSAEKISPHLQLGSHVTEPISTSKIYFRSPLVEIWAPILHTTRSRRAKSTERGDNFSVANLIYRMGTWKRIRPLKSQPKRLEEEKRKIKSLRTTTKAPQYPRWANQLYWKKSSVEMAEVEYVSGFRFIIIIELSEVQFGLKSYAWFQNRTSGYDFRPKLHDPKFNYLFIRYILKSHSLIA